MNSLPSELVPGRLDPTAELVDSDLILLLLANSPEHDEGMVEGIMRLEKLLFLASQKYPHLPEIQQAFRFRHFDYGPYSKEIYDLVFLLEHFDLISIQRVYLGHQPLSAIEEWLAGIVEREEATEQRLSLTAQGLAIAQLLQANHPQVAAALAAIQEQCGSFPLSLLIRYIYSAHPV